MKIYTEVTHCIRGCPFWSTKGGKGTPMICTHPIIEYLEEDMPEDIPKIDYTKHKDSVPENCPLKDTPVNTHVSLKR